MAEQGEDTINLNDPHVQGFIEAVVACGIYALQQQAQAPEGEQEEKPLALEVWRPSPPVVMASGKGN